MTAKPTQGPWDRTSDLEVYSSTLHRSICMVLDAGDDGEASANARLIAAAPMLLEALQGLIAVAEGKRHPGTEWKCIDAARAAIAKATGGEA